MKEWLVVAGDDQAWKELSEEALSQGLGKVAHLAE
jgi:hypothetical protein